MSASRAYYFQRDKLPDPSEKLTQPSKIYCEVSPKRILRDGINLKLGPPWASFRVVLQSARETKPPKADKVNSFSDLVGQLTDGLFGVRCEADSATDHTWPERIQAIALSAFIGV
jgi:hypothetical protein